MSRERRILKCLQLEGSDSKSWEVDELGSQLGISFDVVNREQFEMGLNVELEHGSKLGESTNITQDDPVMTARIVLAHLKEIPDYYTRLKAMEDAAKPIKEVATSTNVDLEPEKPTQKQADLIRKGRKVPPSQDLRKVFLSGRRMRTDEDFGRVYASADSEYVGVGIVGIMDPSMYGFVVNSMDDKERFVEYVPNECSDCEELFIEYDVYRLETEFINNSSLDVYVVMGLGVEFDRDSVRWVPDTRLEPGYSVGDEREMERCVEQSRKLLDAMLRRHHIKKIPHTEDEIEGTQTSFLQEFRKYYDKVCIQFKNK